MSLLCLAFGNWFSRAYLVAVAVIAVLVTASLASWDRPDANLAGIWLIFATLPFSLLGFLAVDSTFSTTAVIGSIALGALVNATVIGLVVAMARREPAAGRSTERA